MGKAKGFLAEFKEFAYRGNVVDMAVGVIIGAAFKAIVDSLVADVVMPFIGIFVDTTSFADIVWRIGAADIMIGKFIAAVINFLMVALVIFCMIKAMNKFHDRMQAIKKKEEEQAKEQAAEEPAPTTEQLLADILTELRRQNTDPKV